MPGQTVVAEGVGFANAIGKVLEVWQLAQLRRIRPAVSRFLPGK